MAVDLLAGWVPQGAVPHVRALTRAARQIQDGMHLVLPHATIPAPMRGCAWELQMFDINQATASVAVHLIATTPSSLLEEVLTVHLLLKSTICSETVITSQS